jgi:hypothetical protein
VACTKQLGKLSVSQLLLSSKIIECHTLSIHQLTAAVNAVINQLSV